MHLAPVRRAAAVATALAVLALAGAPTVAATTVAPSEISGTWQSPVVSGQDAGQAVFVRRAAGAAYATGSIAVTTAAGDPVTTLPLDAFGGAWFDLGTLTPGIHRLTFAYSGDAAYAPTSTVRDVTVLSADDPTAPQAARARAHVTLAGPEQAIAGAQPAYEVHVTGAGATPTGTVSVFSFDSDEPYTTPSPVTLHDGTATVTLPAAPPGTFAMTVAYSGDDSYLPANQAHSAVPLVVAPAPEEPQQPTPTPTPTPTVTPTPDAVPVLTVPASVTTTVGTPAVVRLGLGDVRPASPVTIREGGTVLAKVTDLSARTSIDVTLPVLEPGTHVLSVSAPAAPGVAAVERTLTVVVTGEPERATTQPSGTVATATTSLAPGTSTEMVARGFTPGETVAFYLHSDPILLGTAVADAAGVARLVVTVPVGAAAGAHHVLAIGGTSGSWSQLAVTLAAPAARGTLPVTGAEPWALAATAAVTVAVGGALLLARRRSATGA
ncbi:Ig-like domain-containing protein [Cellulomonas fimi]|uniref:LPXTG-motif cell wall anchor domain protein n=1 Tax=Cellulomonas fimi (strain ATCC 484 / DSM 20113 / JCM 1341 / CCUG 24087 / LMG 16345 / NBRC 15513 / NCIMB 8980 / NCTC 7547 / NRS-133) TaxID=590998 RepID=F4GYS2_CELFA|nr:Ig-like domain-containing protein [Cellulomonas fimi]AEE44791.1 LPXTG-motif cell wall anchor domain protein [Cellulomonas fimi ATCC 484]NNH06070.1 Ig-like domain repeat protein [Cellulomonas fimi]VEH27301.1 Uncharacterised protein [Cellulomonas fimi]